MSTRLPDWQARLNAVLADWRARPFAWGEADCVAFAGAVCVAVRGDNPLDRAGAVYADDEGAQACLDAAGHASLLAALRARLGKPVRPALAQPGDLVFFATGDGGGLGVVNGAMIWGIGDAGLERLDPAAASLAWRL